MVAARGQSDTIQQRQPYIDEARKVCTPRSIHHDAILSYCHRRRGGRVAQVRSHRVPSFHVHRNATLHFGRAAAFRFGLVVASRFHRVTERAIDCHVRCALALSVRLATAIQSTVTLRLNCIGHLLVHVADDRLDTHRTTHHLGRNAASLLTACLLWPCVRPRATRADADAMGTQRCHGLIVSARCYVDVPMKESERPPRLAMLSEQARDPQGSGDR